MLSVVFKHGAVEITDDTVAISDNFKVKPNEQKHDSHTDEKHKSRFISAAPAPKKEHDENVFVIDAEEQEQEQAASEKETKPYVFPSLAEKESEYEAAASEPQLGQEEQEAPDASNDIEKYGINYTDETEKSGLKLLCDEMLQKAISQASSILEDAHARAHADYQELMQAGHAEIEKAKEEGYAAGAAEGTRAQVENIRSCVEQLEHTVAAIEGRQEEYLAKCEQDLKWLALEIAQKVLNERISADELALYPLVCEAVAKQRGATSITVEISEDAPLLLQKLRSELEKGSENISVAAVSAPMGTCRVQTPESFIDASLYRQLDNLRDYFAAQD